MLLIAGFSFAQSVSLTIFNNSGQQFFVIMNGIRQNSLPQTNVKIGGMTTGSYALKLIFADGKTGDINKNIFLDESGDYLARVKFKGKKGKLQYFGMADGTQPVPAGGNAIEYRPNDQSIYSDQPIAAQPLPQVTQPVMTAPQNSGTVNGQQNVTYSQTPPPTGSVYGQTYGQGTVTTTTTVTDPNTQAGQGGMNININIQDPTATGTGGITTTISDPNNPNGQMSTNVVISGAPVTGNTNVPPSISQQPTEYGAPVTIPDPNIPSGFGIHINADGSVPSGAVSTSTTTTSSTTINGQTTSQQTTTIMQNGEAVTTTVQTNGSGASSGDSYTIQQTVKDPSGVPMCTEVLTNADALIADINGEDFEANKREMVEFRLKNTCLNADQAYRIINAFDFESDRLDLSKFLYVHLTDKTNGSRLLELFDFDSSKKELQKFMSTH
jgi:hypothetical protein